MTQRALIFGGSVAWGAVAAVFVFDLLVAPRGWCGHVCPVGAAYGLIGHASVLRVMRSHSSRCNDCADCFAVCPEPQVIAIPLKGKDGASPVITASDCTNCGRCIDVCRPGRLPIHAPLGPAEDLTMTLKDILKIALAVGIAAIGAVEYGHAAESEAGEAAGPARRHAGEPGQPAGPRPPGARPPGRRPRLRAAAAADPAHDQRLPDHEELQQVHGLPRLPEGEGGQRAPRSA